MNKKLTNLVAVLAALALPVTAVAQDVVPQGRFSVNNFVPAVGDGNYLATDGARVTSHMTPNAGVVFDYANKPLVVFTASCTDETMSNCSVDDTDTALVSSLITAHLWGSLTLGRRVQLSLTLPVVLSFGDDFLDSGAGVRPVVVDGGDSAGIGDLRLGVKARLFGAREGLALAMGAWVTAPLGHAIADEGFLGDESVTAGGALIGELVQGGLHVAANVGGYYRPNRTLLSTEVGSGILYRVAVGYEVNRDVLIFGELDGSSSLSTELVQNPLEGRLGARLRFGDFNAGLGLGAGLVSGAGVPNVRVLASFGWAPQKADADGDGVPDGVDQCPDQAEDLDGLADEDGCPETDVDGDEIPDERDQCPSDAEDDDDFEDEDGCPDNDNDQDGITDGFDSCPNTPEDHDNSFDDDGCPEEDTDGDDVTDDRDQCVDEPEDIDGIMDEDGCPETDADEDGVPDEQDECPLQNSGMEGGNGCP